MFHEIPKQGGASSYNDSTLYGRFKYNALKGFPYWIYNFSSRCMHFYLTCPSIICTHNIPNVTHTLCQIKAKLSHIIFHTPMHVFFPIGIVNQINKVDNIAYPWNKISVEWWQVQNRSTPKQMGAHQPPSSFLFPNLIWLVQISLTMSLQTLAQTSSPL